MKEKNSRSVRWIFNSLMLWGAVLGFLVVSGTSIILDAWDHQGSGTVWYEQPDRAVRVSQSQYKRHEYVKGGVLLIFGLGLWIAKANEARKDAGEDKG